MSRVRLRPDSPITAASSFGSAARNSKRSQKGRSWGRPVELMATLSRHQASAALGGAGELVTAPGQIGPALRRAFDAGVPYLVNVSTDPAIAYPPSTTGV